MVQYGFVTFLAFQIAFDAICMYSVKSVSVPFLPVHKAEMDLESVTIMLSKEMPSISFASRLAAPFRRDVSYQCLCRSLLQENK